MAEAVEERGEKRESFTWDEVLDARRWTKRQAEWVIRQWQHSGRSVRRFAEEHGLDPQRVYLWRRRFGAQSSRKADTEKKRSSTGMVEVKLVQSARAGEHRLDIELVSGRRLSVGEHIDMDLLARVVAALERPC